jgi:hypothetical protein
MRRPRGGADYKDGVYAPQKIADQQGGAASRSGGWFSGSSSGSSSEATHAKRIEDDYPAAPTQLN